MIAALLTGLILHTTGTTAIQAHICRNPIVPVLQSPSDGSVLTISHTNVTGYADPNVTIDVQDNGQLAANLTTDSSGKFGSSINLDTGQNLLIVTARNACGTTATASAITVTYNPPTPVYVPPSPVSSGTAPPSVLVPRSSGAVPTTQTPPTTTAQKAPKLRVFSPQHVITHGASIRITGSTAASARVAIHDNNKQLISLTADLTGYFSALVPLQIGKNNIVITATSASGTTTTTLTIDRGTGTTPTLQSPPQTQWYAEVLAIFVLIILLVRFLARRKKAV